MPNNFRNRLNSLAETSDIQGAARLGTRYIGSKIGATGEPQRQYMWQVSVKSTGDEFSELMFYARSTSIPQKTSEPVQIDYMGERFFFSSKSNESKQLTVNFWDDDEGSIQRYFHQWYSYLNTPAYSKSVTHSHYIRDIEIVMKDNMDVLVSNRYIFKMCFPVDIGEIELSYDNVDVVQFPVTFQFHKQFLR